MRIKTIALAAVCGLGIAAFAVPARAQKVDVTFDKSASFKKYKRYAWGKNSLVTRQTADAEAQIEKEIESAADRQLSAKGFVLDPAHPDFVIHYDAGAMPMPEASDASWTQPVAGNVMLSGTFSGVTMDVWLQVTGVLKFSVHDAASKGVVWTSVVTAKTNDPKKFMRNVDSEINKLVTKGLQKFPPK